DFQRFVPPAATPAKPPALQIRFKFQFIGWLSGARNVEFFGFAGGYKLLHDAVHAFATSGMAFSAEDDLPAMTEILDDFISESRRRHGIQFTRNDQCGNIRLNGIGEMFRDSPTHPDLTGLFLLRYPVITQKGALRLTLHFFLRDEGYIFGAGHGIEKT